MLQEFPDGLVVKTACLHCQGSGGSIPGKETKILHAPEAQPGEKKKISMFQAYCTVQG